MSASQQVDSLVEWIAQSVGPETGRGALAPISGGSDSALCFWLCARALPPGRAIGLYVGHALRRRDWFESVGTVESHDLTPASVGFEPEAVRWALTLGRARKHRCWITGSRNRTEEVFGTYSLASRICTLLPLAGLWKSQVMALCDFVGVPAEITESSRRADPACQRPKEMADIPFGVVDLFLQIKIGERPESELRQIGGEQLEYLESIYSRNKFKRLLPMRAPVSQI